MKKPFFERQVDQKLDQWKSEATIAAADAVQKSKEATLVIYPSGLRMMRFAEPNTDYGMHYEVAPEVWQALLANGGKVIA